MGYYNGNNNYNKKRNNVKTNRGAFRPSYNANRDNEKRAEQRTVHRGEIYYTYRTNQEAVGSEVMEGHPCVIISSEEFCKNSGVVCAVYLTSAPVKDLDTYVVINNNNISSTAICEQVISISKSRLCVQPLGKVSELEMKLIDNAVASSLGFNITHDCNEIPYEITQLRTERDTYKKMYDSLINRLTKHGN